MNNKLSVFGSAALWVADCGYTIFPLSPRTKIPFAGSGGIKDATTDPDQIRKWWTDHPDANIGLATGRSNVIVIDIDGDRGRDSLPKLESIVGPIGNTLTVITPGKKDKGKGMHLYFSNPENRTYPASCGKLPGIDIRCGETYVLAPPSVHPHGGSYIFNGGSAYGTTELLPVPDLSPLFEKATPAPPLLSPYSKADVVHRAEKYVDACPPAISGQGGHASLLRVVNALLWGFQLDEHVVRQIVHDRFNPRCEPPWSEKEIDHKISESQNKPPNNQPGWLLKDKEHPLNNSHATAPHFTGSDDEPVAQVRDVTSLGYYEGLDDDDEPVGYVIEDPGPFPVRLFEVPGLMGDVAKHITESNFVKQPPISLAASISLMGTLISQFYQTPRNTRSNTYILVLAESSAGKERGRKVIKHILSEIGFGKRFRENYASHQAIQKDVARNPIIWLWDELGKLLPSMNAKNPHLSGIFPILMRLYSSADTIFVGDMRACDEEPVIIDQPHLVIYGSSTLQETVGAFTTSMMSDGFLARCHLFEADDTVEGPDDLKEDSPAVPESIIKQAMYWSDLYHSPQPDKKTLLAFPNPRTVPQTPEALEVLNGLLRYQKQQRKTVEKPYSDLWGKVIEQADQFALIYACSANPESPVIDADAANWACSLAKYLTKRKIWLAYNYIADDPFEKLQREVLRFIREKGGEVTQSQLTKRFWRMKPKDRKDLFENLKSTKRVVIKEEKTATKTRYYWSIR